MAINEFFLHFLWKERLYDPESLVTDNNQMVEIINPGTENKDAGPDFMDARIRIGGTLWAGNVEIHLRASDWMAHGHYKDPLYDSVILHVVGENDQTIFSAGGDALPVMTLIYDQKLEENYLSLKKNREWVACRPYLHRFDPFRIRMFLGQLVVERLEKYTSEIEAEMQRTKNDWEEVLYRFLARGFGLRVNAHPFLLLARSLPLSYLAKHRDNLRLVEALFFGQAGWLQSELFGDPYYEALKKDYHFVQQKFSLQPLPTHIWRFLRLRPSNFPTVRLAQFARLIHENEHLYSRIMEARDLNTLREIFKVAAGEYWETHYVFNKPAKSQKKTFGTQAFQTLLINVIIPLYFIYGKRTGSDEFREKALDLLEQLPPEKNQIIRKWAEAGIGADSAFYSQALVQLKNEYCNPGRCLECRIGRKLIINL